MPNFYENQISPKEYDFESDLQRDRARQQLTAPVEEATEKTGSNLNIIELTLALILAMGTDFGIGFAGAKLAAAAAAIPVIGTALMTVIMFLAKFGAICVAAILWLWCLLRFKKLPSKRLFATTLVEMIPFIGELAPGWTVFVLSVIIKEKIMPMIQKYGVAAEKVAGAIPLPQAQAAAKAIKTAQVASKVAEKV